MSILTFLHGFVQKTWSKGMLHPTWPIKWALKSSIETNTQYTLVRYTFDMHACTACRMISWHAHTHSHSLSPYPSSSPPHYTLNTGIIISHATTHCDTGVHWVQWTLERERLISTRHVPRGGGVGRTPLFSGGQRPRKHVLDKRNYAYAPAGARGRPRRVGPCVIESDSRIMHTPCMVHMWRCTSDRACCALSPLCRVKSVMHDGSALVHA